MRLDRILANLGYGSRAEVRQLIQWGVVDVRDLVERDPGLHASASDVTLRGQPLDHPQGVLVALHKPVGFASSHDEREQPLVYELLPERWRARNPQVVSVGRLDRESSGLLVLTDDHALVHRLTSPSRHVDKVYRATLDAPMPSDVPARFLAGIALEGEDRPCRPATVIGRAEYGPTVVEVTLTEGRYHQVRRMFAAVGLHVAALHRVRFGPWSLDDLSEGAWRDLVLPAG